MKKIILSSFFMMICIFAKSQSNFEIKKIGDQYTSAQITTVFNSADFCGSYYQSKRNLITLNDGSEIELKSKSELIALGINISDNCFLDDSTPYHSAIWSISNTNKLMKGSNNDINTFDKKMRISNNNGQ